MSLHALRTPKANVLLFFGVLLAIALPATAESLPLEPILINLAAAVLTAGLLDLVCLRVETGAWLWPTSALLSALFVAFILSPNESTLVVAWTSGFAIVVKRIVRTRREHIFNPAALALVWAPVAFGSGESWWGALGDVSWPWTAVLIVGGWLIVQRLNKLPMVLMFLATYFTLFTAVALVQPSTVAEMFRAPFVQAALFLAFLMLTDPPTSPNRYRDQVWFGALAAVLACLAQLFGAGQVYLLLGLLGANMTLALTRVRRRRATMVGCAPLSRSPWRLWLA